MLKLLTVKFEEETESFNDAILANFLSDKKIMRWESNFFEKKGSHYWAVLLEYETLIPPVEKVSSKPEEKKEDNYKELLKEEDWPIFKRLREWRGEVSKKEGVPPYIIFTNMQLAKIAVTRPGSLNALQQIYGVGDIKKSKYGKQIIGIISSSGKLPGKGKKESGIG